MKKIIPILILAIGALTCAAHYSLHSITGNVILESGGKTTPAKAGMTVKASDYVVIPKGGKVEVINNLDKRIYTSIKAGKISITRLMIEAKGVASDNAANVAARMKLGKKDRKEDKVYVEKGMVRRTLEVCDSTSRFEELPVDSVARTVGQDLPDPVVANPDSTVNAAPEPKAATIAN